MAKKSGGSKKEKRVAVKLYPIVRVHAGKVVEVWKLLESLIKEMAASPRFEHLKLVKIRMFWTQDWKVDADGIATGAKVVKASERDRLLAEESGGETPDFFIILPKEQWPHLTDAEREQRLFHELCSIRPAMDTNGKQKVDTKDRLQWRLGRQPIVAFPEEVERFGVDSVLGRNDRIRASQENASRPLLASLEQAFTVEAESTLVADGWKSMNVVELDLSPAVRNYLESAGMDTLGMLSTHMARSGAWWAKDLKVGGMRKPPKFAESIEEGFTQFWAKHPEFTKG